MFLYIFIVMYLAIYIWSKYSTKWCKSKVCLVGKTAIVTGANSGIGFSTARDLAMRGCKVIMADNVNCTKSRDKIIWETKNKNVIAKKLDLQSLKSVREFASDILNEENEVHILICNAGIGTVGFTFTEDNLQRTMQVNYFGHFLLVHLLLGCLKKSAPSRVIFTSSIASYLSKLKVECLNPGIQHTNYWNMLTTSFYGNSKLALACASVSFTKHFKHTGVTFNSLHPGLVRSNIFSAASKTDKNVILGLIWIWTLLFGKSVEEGAQTLIYLACSSEVENVSGKFFMECGEAFYPPPLMADDELCQDIWEKSIELVKLEKQKLII